MNRPDPGRLFDNFQAENSSGSFWYVLAPGVYGRAVQYRDALLTYNMSYVGLSEIKWVHIDKVIELGIKHD